MTAAVFARVIVEANGRYRYAITMTNSGKPIGRWVDEIQAAPFMSVTSRDLTPNAMLSKKYHWLSKK